MIYRDNEEMSKEFTKFLIDLDISKAEIARRLGVVPQTLHQTIRKKNFSFADMSKILATIGYKLEYDFVPDSEKPPDEKK